MEYLYTLHATYAKRVHEVDTWRHIQVAFLYTVAVPGLGYLVLGGNCFGASPARWIVAIAVVGCVTVYAVTFAAWSHKRVLVLVRALETIEQSPNFLPEFNGAKDWLYWTSDLQMVRLYRWATMGAAWLQVPLLGAAVFACYNASPSGLQWALFILVVVVLAVIQTLICRKLICPELAKLEQPIGAE